jgi:hypothetical protein
MFGFDMLTLGIQGLIEGESGLKTIELSYRQKKKFHTDGAGAKPKGY